MPAMRAAVTGGVCLLCAARSARAAGATLSSFRISTVQVLDGSRFGALFVPLSLLYPGSVLVSCTVLFYGDQIGYQMLAAVDLILLLLLPVVLRVRRVDKFARLAPLEGGWAVRVFYGKEEWVARWWLQLGTNAKARVYRLLYDSYKYRHRHLFAGELA
eukprot:gene19292-9562_t